MPGHCCCDNLSKILSSIYVTLYSHISEANIVLFTSLHLASYSFIFYFVHLKTEQISEKTIPE